MIVVIRRLHSSTMRKNIFLWLTCVIACQQLLTIVSPREETLR